jgi:iron complex outermembrane receptor protein
MAAAIGVASSTPNRLFRVLKTRCARRGMRFPSFTWLIFLAASQPFGVAFSEEVETTEAGTLSEVVVTAQKREQSANSVGMSVSTATGDTLRERGIDDITQLPEVVPGLSVQDSAFHSQSVTLRGIGFFNSDLSSPPAVTVYLDEAPLPYPAMAPLAPFDLERVEVLKGPQGTLFGQDSTGGAINYIAAKPSETFQSGFDAAYGRFNRVQANGFVTGPINDQLHARIAVEGQRGDGWQQSITRPGDRLGRIRSLQERASLDWQPGNVWLSRLTLGVFHDGSDSLAGQFVAAVPHIPQLAVPGLLTFPVVTTPLAADWTRTRLDSGQPFPYADDTTHFQAILRNEYRINASTLITALTEYSHSHIAYGQDPDGTPFHINEIIDDAGRISAFFQELRASGVFADLRWLAGANFEHDTVSDAQENFVEDNDVCHLFQSTNPQAYCDFSLYTGRTKVNTSGVFARAEEVLTDQLTLETAIRYNADRRTFDNCGITLTQTLANYWNASRGYAPPPSEVGQCFVMDPANHFQPVSNVHRVLNQDNVSWRLGLDWNPTSGFLAYANASKGYKAGTVPVLAGTSVAQYTPVPQESVLAYEIGFKAGLLERRAQLNLAAFYDDYRDKQLRGSELDPTFGPLEALVSIPRSHVAGAEAQVSIVPLEGLTIDAGATYVKTRIDDFTGFNALAQYGSQVGTVFPFSPRWQTDFNAEYQIPLSATVKTFLGSSLHYRSRSYAGIGELDIQRIDPYTLLDLRAGIDLRHGRYRIWAWARNVTDRYYWTNVLPYGNTISRYVGQPATYGFSISGRFEGG